MTNQKFSKDTQTFFERQAREKEEKRQALIATVVSRLKPHHGRLPRKVGTITVDTGIKNAYRKQTASFVLRMDVDTGEFIAEHGNMLYASKTREALQAKMDEVGKISMDLKWTRYLEVAYKVTAGKGENWDNHELKANQKRPKGIRIYGLSLTWEVVEFSNSFTIPGEDQRFMTRAVDKNGKAAEAQETVRTLPDGLIVYSPAREALLNSISAAFTEMDAKMLGLLWGDADAVAAKMDALSSKRLFLLTDGKVR